MPRIVTFDYDLDPDFSWLEQDHYNPAHPSYQPVYRNAADRRRQRNPITDYADPSTHVALQMTVRDSSTGEVIDVLGGIDFLHDEDNWGTGTFYFVTDIPRKWRYLRHLAREAGMRYRPRVVKV